MSRAAISRTWSSCSRRCGSSVCRRPDNPEDPARLGSRVNGARRLQLR
jgi:hypothetical protein